jgi:hypothetical protein
MAEESERNPESRTWLQKTSYEFILRFGGGGVTFLPFLPTSALSLVVHPDKPEHTDKVYETPKERVFNAVLHTFGPFF